MIWLEGGGEELVAAWCEAILNREDLALQMLVGQDLKDVEPGLDSFDNVPHVEGEDEKWIQIDVRDFMVFGDCQSLLRSREPTGSCRFPVSLRIDSSSCDFFHMVGG